MMTPMGKQQDVGGTDRHSGSGAAAQDATDGGVEARLALAQDPGTAHLTLIDLAADPSPAVRRAVATRADAPAQALRPLTRDHDREVREAVARNPSTSIANLLRLVKDADRWVRWAVAGNPACDESVRRVMAQTADKELRGLLAESRDLEPELAARLVADVSPEVRERLAIHTHDPEVITALLADRTARVRKGLARNPRTTAAHRSALAQDPVPDVRAALVLAVALDEADLRLLVDDRSVQVRMAVATSEVVPSHLRQVLADDPDEMVAGAAREFRPGAGASPVVRAPRVRSPGTGPVAVGRATTPGARVRARTTGPSRAARRALAAPGVFPAGGLCAKLLGGLTGVALFGSFRPDGSIMWRYRGQEATNGACDVSTGVDPTPATLAGRVRPGEHPQLVDHECAGADRAAWLRPYLGAGDRRSGAAHQGCLLPPLRQQGRPACGISRRVPGGAARRAPEDRGRQRVPAVRVRELIRFSLTSVAEYRAHVTIFYQERRYLTGDLFAEVTRKRGLVEAAFAGMIADGVTRGVFRPDVDPRIATFGLVGMCAWAYQWLNVGGPLSVDEVARQFSAMVLEGLSA